MPRFSRRRTKRKPKARKRIDKLQNKRLTRLEESIEKKFAIHPVRQVTLTSALTSSVAQIYRMLPDLSGSQFESVADPLIGNQLSLKRVNVKYCIGQAGQSVNDPTSFSARVIFFWNICPRTWSTTTDPPSSTAVGPSWEQLLNNPVLDGTVGGPSFNNTTTCQQQITKSNKSPIVILSDRVHQMSTKSGKLAVHGSFNKQYKAMKLTYNNFLDTTATLQPVNRQLYMAVILDQLDGGNEPEANTITMSYSTVMHYTDA